MKIARVALGGEPRLGVVVEDRIRLLPAAASAAVAHDVGALPGSPPTIELLRQMASEPAWPDALPLSGARFLSPLGQPGKIVAVGRNYALHALEDGAEVPPEPLTFAKFPSAIIGPGDPINWDAQLTQEVDFEAELAVVIGRRSRRVSLDGALGAVFGYTCLNDVSARDLQFGDGQWVRGKSLDSFCPVGPWVVTSDEVDDPQALAIKCVVSGEVLQDATTAQMIFGVAELVSRLSHWFTLNPGDVIATGTPDGVGYHRNPRRLLRDGDTVDVVIEGIGTLRNPVRVH